MKNQKAFDSGVATIDAIAEDLIFSGATQMDYASLAKLNKAVFQIMTGTGLDEIVVFSVIHRSIKEARDNGPKGYAKKDYFISEMTTQLSKGA